MFKDRVILKVHNVLRPWPLEDNSVNQIVFSPPYWRARDYGADDQLGTEPLHDCLKWASGEEPEAGCCFVCNTRIYAREAYRVLHPSGTMTINIGDTYAGSGKGPTKGQSKKNTGSATPHLATGTPGKLKKKDKVGIPYRVAMALQADGWYWRSEFPWIKTSGMPSNYKDRPLLTHEHMLVFAKKGRYFWDAFATLVPARSNVNFEPAYYGFLPEQAGLDEVDNTFRRTTDWVEEELQQMINYHSDMARHLIEVLHDNDGVLGDGHGDFLLIRSPNGGNQKKHYAGFHPELIRPIVRAGTSRFGVCAECLSPYKRMTARKVIGRERRVRSQLVIGDDREQHVSDNMAEYKVWVTTGWAKTCKCKTDAVKRPVILDPFMGGGTTMQVALEEGCDVIGFDVNPTYVQECEFWLDTLEPGPRLSLTDKYDFGLFAKRHLEEQS